MLGEKCYSLIVFKVLTMHDPRCNIKHEKLTIIYNSTAGAVQGRSTLSICVMTDNWQKGYKWSGKSTVLEKEENLFIF